MVAVYRRLAGAFLICIVLYCASHLELFTYKPSFASKQPRTYSEVLSVGRERAKTLSVAMGGLVRDSEAEIPHVYKHLKETGALFKSYDIFFFENDSKDNTPALLQKYSQQDSRTHVKSVKLNLRPAVQEGARSASRFERMASFRNELYEDVLKSGKHYDVVLFVDTDVYLGWEVDGVATSFFYSPWDVMCAYGATHDGEMYDTLAFRDDTFPDTRVVAQLDGAHRPYMTRVEPFKARSCFGGLALYNASSIGTCRYSGVADCEHVELHSCMAGAGSDRIYVNPTMILYYGFFIWRKEEFAAWGLAFGGLLVFTYMGYCRSSGPVGLPFKKLRKKSSDHVV